ncbi:MAG: tRNA-binding protein [Flavobacterium sp.]|nr:tRNA-binding protein [Flavobacterium sp.]
MESDRNISWNEFENVEMRVGTVISAEDFPEARKPAFKLRIDFGEAIGVLRTSAQITQRYAKEELIGRQIVAVVNFPEKQIANFISQCLILGAMGEGGDVVLLHTDATVPNGLRIG